MKGKSTSVAIHEILGEGDEEKETTKREFETGLQKFLDRRFAEAIAHFDRVARENPDDRAAILYRQQAADLMTAGVPDDWDGSG